MSTPHSLGHDPNPTPTSKNDSFATGEAPHNYPHDSTSESVSFSPSPTDAPPKIDNYDMLEVLGRGGFGVVWKAFDVKLNRLVAIKMMSAEMALTSSARNRFSREARAMAAVRHENVVQVYSVEEQPIPYFVMELIPGETLQRRLARTGPLAISEVARLGTQLARGLAAAHAVGLIHRDMKPANIMLEGVPTTAKIADFGLARVLDEPSLTASGLVVGTPLYMSPEQACGTEVDHRADLYSLGGVLYAMLTGKPPVSPNNMQAMMYQVVNAPVVPIQTYRPDAPGWLIEIVSKLMAKDPNHRFQTAFDAAIALEFGENRPVPPTPPPVRAKPNRWMVAALVVVASCAGIGLALWGQNQSNRANPSSALANPDSNSTPPTRRTDSPATKPVPATKPATPTKPAFPKYSPDGLLKTHAPMSAPIETSLQVSGKVDLTRLPLTYTNEFRMDFVLIHAGVVKEYWRDQWLNTREFTIPVPFYIGIHEVTLKQWRDVVGKSSVVSKFSREGPKADFMKKLPDSVVDQYPVNGITWDEAQVFVYSLNRKSLNKNWFYRLPLAGEWQAACQGGTQNAIHDTDYQFYLKD